MASSRIVATGADGRRCLVNIRRVDGRNAREIHFSCQPSAAGGEPETQAAAVYHTILETLGAEGASYGAVVSEWVFLRNAQADLHICRRARDRVLTENGSPDHQPAITCVEQPPLDADAALAILVHAVIPKTDEERAVHGRTLSPATACQCPECSLSRGYLFPVGAEHRLQTGNLYGYGADAYRQTHSLFELAEDLLERAGMAFSDVTRTWIYLSEMNRDYPDLNRARREFFRSRRIDPSPASTGIGAGLAAPGHDISLAFSALQADALPPRAVMTTPTLNEAPVYGADFSRGMRIEDSNKIGLLVSGTASLDETGATVHVGDFDAQAHRMLVNVAALLEGQGATFGDVVSAITYVKDPANADRLREKFRESGFEGFPNVLVEAVVCRPELLCETEVLAVLRRPHPGQG
ncbi:Rid family hydrolase [Lentisalinibacter orientalis]|uniref:Rid family hydrolase n=1 Tax=Lentisalinibacter orientalis TaxID=2992241 RepID=UPI00386AE7EB